jgi:hypothetical protein
VRKQTQRCSGVLLLAMAAACSGNGGRTNTEKARGEPAPGPTPQVVDHQGGILQGEAAFEAQRQAGVSAEERDAGARVVLQSLGRGALHGRGTLEHGGPRLAARKGAAALPHAATVAPWREGGAAAGLRADCAGVVRTRGHDNNQERPMANERRKTRREGDGEDKGAEQRGLGERLGQEEDGPPLHPAAKESGTKGASNAGEDETSGSE